MIQCVDNIKNINKKISKHIKKLDEVDYKELRKNFEQTKNYISVDQILQKQKFDTKIIPSAKGLYLIQGKFDNEIEKSWTHFCNKWKEFNEKTPDIIEYRKENLKLDLKKYQPFYLGKAININDRVNEHFYCLKKKSDEYLKSTSALRLLQFFTENKSSKLLKEMKFNIYYLELDIEDAVLYHLEKKLRDSLSCLIGKH